jgi:hypothetical protein
LQECLDGFQSLRPHSYEGEVWRLCRGPSLLLCVCEVLHALALTSFQTREVLTGEMLPRLQNIYSVLRLLCGSDTAQNSANLDSATFSPQQEMPVDALRSPVKSPVKSPMKSPGFASSVKSVLQSSLSFFVSSPSPSRRANTEEKVSKPRRMHGENRGAVATFSEGRLLLCARSIVESLLFEVLKLPHLQFNHNDIVVQKSFESFEPPNSPRSLPSQLEDSISTDILSPELHSPRRCSSPDVQFKRPRFLPP